MVMEFDLEFNIEQILDRNSKLYQNYDRGRLVDFILERLKRVIGVDPSSNHSCFWHLMRGDINRGYPEGLRGFLGN